MDLSEGVLTIRHSTFDRFREVPLHPSTVAALLSYERRRERPVRRSSCPTPQYVFLTAGFARTFALVAKVPIAPSPSSHVRIHDARHTFAVNVLTRWHDEGADVRAPMPWLSTCMGHVNLASTYRYLSTSPKLLEHAVTRLETTYEATS